jgi:FkbM family methyltransferase
MNMMFYKMYSKIIDWCNRKTPPSTNFEKIVVTTVENILHLTSIVLSRFKHIHFPQRVLGTRFWIWRWRVEFLMGWMEYETMPWVKKYIKHGMTVVDIGAHIGYYTDIFSRLTKSHGKVFAFDASPENYPLLTRNIEERNRDNVIAFHRAVSDQNGIVQLYVSPGHTNHSLVAGFTQAEKTVSVESVRLDDFLDVERIDFVKMDVEGSEVRVLNGMRRLIQASKGLVMIVEYNRIALGKAYPSPQILLDLLTELGFEYHAILSDGSLGAIPEDTKTINLLCVSK